MNKGYKYLRKAPSLSRVLFIMLHYCLFTMGRRIDPSWGGPIELFLVPASAPRLV